MRSAAIFLICSLTLFSLAAAVSAQSGPPGPACHVWGDALAASAMVLQRGIPSFLEVEVALQNKMPGRIQMNPARFVLIPNQGEPVMPLTLEQAKQAARDSGRQVFSLLFWGFFGFAEEAAIQEHWQKQIVMRFFKAGDLLPGVVVKGSVYFIPNPRLTQFSLRLDGLTTEVGERLVSPQLTNCLLPPRPVAPAPAAAPQASPSPAYVPEVRTVALNARAVVGPVIVSVSSVEFSRDATMLAMIVENTGEVEADLFSAVGNATLTDNAGKSYAVRFLRSELADRVAPRGQIGGRLAFEPLPFPPAVNSAILTMPEIRVGSDVYEAKVQLRF